MGSVGAAFLCAVGRALARIHVEHDALRRSPLVYRVDPPAPQIGKSGEVRRTGQPLGLEAPHLAGRSSPTHRGSPPDHPAPRRPPPQPPTAIHALLAPPP